MPNFDLSETQAVTRRIATSSSGTSSGPDGGGATLAAPRRGRRASPPRLFSMPSGVTPAKRVPIDRAGSVLDHVVATRLADGHRPSVGAVLSSLWAEVDAVLRPFIGSAGVAALLARSVRGAARSHGWLTDLAGSAGAGPDVERLSFAFDGRDRGEATSASLALVRSFCSVLNAAVGESLAARLLQPLVATSTFRRDDRAKTMTLSM